MAVERRTIWLGAALVGVLLVAVVIWTTGGSGSASSGAALPPRVPASAAHTGSATDKQPVGRLDFEALKAERAEPVDEGRNPFRFVPRPAPAPAPSLPHPQNQAAFAPVQPMFPTGPPPPPPIPLKFIGIVIQGTTRVAVLSDGKSVPQSGKEGDIILGQYQILKIGNESIEMAYVDGRGRQTIRLTGQ